METAREAQTLWGGGRRSLRETQGADAAQAEHHWQQNPFLLLREGRSSGSRTFT